MIPPRSVWLDAGNNPQTALLAKYGIRRCYWPSHVNIAPPDKPPPVYARNPMLSAGYFDGWRAAFEVGIYGAASWFGHDVVTLARSLDAVLTFCQQTPKQCAVHANIEHGDALNDLPGAVISFLHEWRALRPRRETAWVVDGLQGGLFTPELLTNLAGLSFNAPGPPIDVYAEAYTGAMQPIPPDAVRSNLVNFGVPRERSLVKYDAATLTPTTFWDGCAFTQGRLRNV